MNAHPGLGSPRVVPPAEGHRSALVWRATGPLAALSSASVGGGLTSPAWVLNLGVDKGYARTDLAAHVAEVAAAAGLEGEGCALLTAADVAQVQEASSGGVRAWATVGVTKPTWAVRPGSELGRTGAPDGQEDDRARHTRVGSGTAPRPGTINVVVDLPVPLTTSALVQAVGTVTEAKAQALLEAGVPGTGTASDAVVVVCPAGGHDQDGRDGPVTFAGVRSPWGTHAARAVHAAVATGLATHPWPPDDADPAETDVVW